MAFALAGAVASVLAVDNRKDTIDEALRLSHEVGVENVGFALANLYALPFADGAFTLATCRNALHRFPEPVAALKEMARVVAPGGRLVVYDLLVSGELDRTLNELARLSDASHRRYETHAEFLEQFAKAGLKVVEERRLHRTVDLQYWLEAAAVDTEPRRPHPHAPAGAAGQDPDGARPGRLRRSGVVLVRRHRLPARARLSAERRRRRRGPRSGATWAGAAPAQLRRPAVRRRPSRSFRSPRR